MAVSERDQTVSEIGIRTLVLFSTVDGHTSVIAERIGHHLERRGESVTLLPLADAPDSLQEFDRVVVGASIRYGKFRPALFDFIERHHKALGCRPSAFFCVNLVARKPNRNTPDTNPYMQQFLRKSCWRPQLLEVFAGKLNYPIYGFWDRQIIRFIMWLTKGPTTPDAVVDYTDWQQVEAFAERVGRL